MNKIDIKNELKEITKEFGDYPYQFFTILMKSDDPNVDFETQNKVWESERKEKWHSLDLSNYLLWSITDNGDLLWWNGEQTILMSPRVSEFLSIPVRPMQFMKLVGLKRVGRILPDDL